MKRTLPILLLSAFSLTLLLTACSSKTAGDAEKANQVSFIDTVGLAAFQDWKAQNERKDASEYMNEPKQATAAPVVRRSSPARSTASQSTASTSTQPAKKKGWSKAAKGAVIGTTTGAVAGAIINKKNRVLGGIVGGVLGGGVGYGIGRGMDKKDGRVN